MARRRQSPYKSGYCSYAPHQHPCPGEFKNGTAVKNPIALCSCECHGDYEARLQTHGIVPPEPEIDNEETD